MAGRQVKCLITHIQGAFGRVFKVLGKGAGHGVAGRRVCVVGHVWPVRPKLNQTIMEAGMSKNDPAEMRGGGERQVRVFAELRQRGEPALLLHSPQPRPAACSLLSFSALFLSFLFLIFILFQFHYVVKIVLLPCSVPSFSQKLPQM